jgi:phosphinothricin acetyltransferase
MDDLRIRDATVDDAGACREVYAPYVTSSAISFELEPPSVDEMAARITSAISEHVWLVAEDDFGVVGYAYAHSWAPRAAYRWSCETSIYLEMGRRRTGTGRRLYRALLDRVAERGYRQALAGVAIPNDASLGLHYALGFEMVGVFQRVGWKNGAWHDVAWLQKSLHDHSDPPAQFLSDTGRD